MKLGVISDSHDHLPNLRHALQQLENAGAAVVVHCGDLVAPFVTPELGRFPGDVHTVFGNNDGDRFLSQRMAATQATNVTHHGELGLVELAGKRFAFSHYMDHARGAARAAACAAGLFGHTHQFHEERVGQLLLLNPGELLGMKGAPGFCLLDTDTLQVERVTFDAQPWPSPEPWA